MDPTPTRGAAGRAAFNSRFHSPEEKSEHFRDLARRAHAERLVLSAGEVSALASAYALLRGIAERHNVADALEAERQT